MCARRDDERATRRGTMENAFESRPGCAWCIREMYRDVRAGINWQKRFIETADAFGGFVYFATNPIKGQYIAFRSDVVRRMIYRRGILRQKISRCFGRLIATHLRCCADDGCK